MPAALFPPTAVLHANQKGAGRGMLGAVNHPHQATVQETVFTQKVYNLVSGSEHQASNCDRVRETPQEGKYRSVGNLFLSSTP